MRTCVCRRYQVCVVYSICVKRCDVVFVARQIIWPFIETEAWPARLFGRLLMQRRGQVDCLAVY